jgi:hypothetical protein
MVMSPILICRMTGSSVVLRGDANKALGLLPDRGGAGDVLGRKCLIAGMDFRAGREGG